VAQENFHAALFDMDGTIIDSEPYWMIAERELVGRFGGTWTEEQGYALVGSGLWNSAALLQGAGVDLPADEIVNLLSDRVLEQVTASIPWRPGVRELFRDLLDADIPMALVTMSFRKNAQALADAVATELGEPVFRAIVAGDDVEHPKPNPEAYLKGATALGVDIAHTVSFEDSSYGAASAFSAGSVTVGIPLHVEIPRHMVHELWDSLAGKGVAEVRATWQRHHHRLDHS
jgi:HAD superfamily hydrolase (TIGR01509 family)